jgi:hypothetical protein
MMQVEGKGGYSSSQSGVQIRGEALSSGKRLAQQVIHELFRIIADINSLPGSDDETITFSLTHDEEITKEEAERDQVYMSMPGVKPTQKFFLNRGFQEDEFEYTENSQEPNQQIDSGSVSSLADREVTDPATFGTTHPASATPPVEMLKAYELLKKKP